MLKVIQILNRPCHRLLVAILIGEKQGTGVSVRGFGGIVLWVKCVGRCGLCTALPPLADSSIWQCDLFCGVRPWRDSGLSGDDVGHCQSQTQ